MTGAVKTMFREGQIVRHVNSQKTYLIVYTPHQCAIEKNAVPAYGYQSFHAGTLWVRPQEEMEDGRFEPIR